MNTKKAAAHEELNNKIEYYTEIIKMMLKQANANPLEYDYTNILEMLIKAHPGDHGAIIIAEKRAQKR